MVSTSIIRLTFRSPQARWTGGVLALAAAATIWSGPVAAQPPRIETLVDSALEHTRAARWPNAIDAYERLATANPLEGTFHAGLGLSYSRSGNCVRAIPALERAIRIGVNGTASGMRQARFFLASCAALAGDTSGALAQLDTAWRQHGLRDFSILGPRFASIMASPRLQAMAGTAPATLTDRTGRWRFDLQYLDKLVRETHPRPFGIMREADWTRNLARVHSEIATRSDHEIIAELMRLVARIGDGHTALYPPMTGPNTWQLLPIWPVYLADGWYVGAASPEHRALVGGRILRAGAIDIARLDSSARAFIASDNEWTGHWLAQAPLQFAEFYQLAGAGEADGSVRLEVAGPDGALRVDTVRPHAFDRSPLARWAPPDWPSMGDGVPRWIRYAPEHARIEWLARDRVLYVALNAVADTDDRTLLQLGTDIRDSLTARRA